MTDIEWTHPPGFRGETWNPTVGCSRVSEGCRHCYAERFVHRGIQEAHKGLTVVGKNGPRWTGKVRCLPERLPTPLHWRSSRFVFVNSLSDLFHDDVPFEFVATVFGVMATTPRHRYVVLTKRPENAVRFMGSLRTRAAAISASEGIEQPEHAISTLCQVMGTEYYELAPGWRVHKPAWPLQNVILGVSVEDQATADERIPLLLQCPAAIRAVSYEPALGPVDFGPWLLHDFNREPHCPWCEDCVDGGPPERWKETREDKHGPFLDWLIVGGESGPGARPFDVAWARSTIAACRDSGAAACFVKQLGARPQLHRAPTGAPDDGGDMESVCLADRKGSDASEWPKGLRVRQWPQIVRPA